MRSELVLIDIGSRVEKILYRSRTHIGEIEWSPDGSELAFVEAKRVPRGTSFLYSIDAIGGDPKLLAGSKDPETASFNWDVAWSNDGRLLAWSSSRGFPYSDMW